MNALDTNDEEFKLFKEIFEGKLDDIDMQIYRLLRNNGRLTDTELAEKLGVSITTARRRRRELQEKGYLQIMGLLYFGPIKIAYADVIVKLNINAKMDEVESFIQDCLQSPYIYEVTEYMGNYILLRFYEKDLEKLNSKIHEFLQNRYAVSDYNIMVATITPKAWNKILVKEEK
ncbi:transcriptional regulator [Euryarchaeota archaeon ex4484_178]|nr:MAG: transcriptional regulator [Euryarchaeota archaeon ex4484_178]